MRPCWALTAHSSASVCPPSAVRTVCPEPFNEIDVPPTLVSFAVDVASDKNIVTPELKKAGDKLVLVKIEKDEYDLPKYDQVMDQYGKFHEDIKAGRIVASYALDAKGLAAAVSKMAFGNESWRED